MQKKQYDEVKRLVEDKEGHWQKGETKQPSDRQIMAYEWIFNIAVGIERLTICSARNAAVRRYFSAACGLRWTIFRRDCSLTHLVKVTPAGSSPAFSCAWTSASVGLLVWPPDFDDWCASVVKRRAAAAAFARRKDVQMEVWFGRSVCRSWAGERLRKVLGSWRGYAAAATSVSRHADWRHTNQHLVVSMLPLRCLCCCCWQSTCPSVSLLKHPL